MNKRLLEQVGVTEEEYKAWCQNNHKPMYKSSSKAEFFKLIREGKLLRDRSKKLVEVKRRKNNDFDSNQS